MASGVRLDVSLSPALLYAEIYINSSNEKITVDKLKGRAFQCVEMSTVHGQTVDRDGQTVKPWTVTTNLTDKRATNGQEPKVTNMSSAEEVCEGGNVEEDVSQQYNLFKATGVKNPGMWQCMKYIAPTNEKKNWKAKDAIGIYIYIYISVCSQQ